MQLQSTSKETTQVPEYAVDVHPTKVTDEPRQVWIATLGIAAACVGAAAVTSPGAGSGRVMIQLINAPMTTKATESLQPMRLAILPG